VTAKRRAAIKRWQAAGVQARKSRKGNYAVRKPVGNDFYSIANASSRNVKVYKAVERKLSTIRTKFRWAGESHTKRDKKLMKALKYSMKKSLYG
jgi:hypothetical protein